MAVANEDFRMKHADLQREVRESFADFAHKRAITDDPQFYSRMAAEGKWVTRLLRLLTLFPFTALFPSGRRYLFLSARHDQLSACFGPADAAVIGGMRELRHARVSGLPFCFAGDLYVAARSLVFGARFVPVGAIVERWIRYLARQQDPCFLVVPNDTMPMALLLTFIARRCPNIRIVCVQHGLLSAGRVYMFDDVEGRNSHVNLVYSTTQRAEMERRLPGRIVEVMGLPAEVGRPGLGEETADDLLLVGTGTFEDTASLSRALDVFAEVIALSGRTRRSVEYRPHPSEETTAMYRRLPVAINRQRKDELLSGKRRVFVGFASTLLYEAHLAGHAVVLLDDERVPAYPLNDFGEHLDARELSRLTEVIDRASVRRPLPETTGRLRGRFDAALTRAMARLENGPLQ